MTRRHRLQRPYIGLCLLEVIRLEVCLDLADLIRDFLRVLRRPRDRRWGCRRECGPGPELQHQEADDEQSHGTTCSRNERLSMGGGAVGLVRLQSGTSRGGNRCGLGERISGRGTAAGRCSGSCKRAA